MKILKEVNRIDIKRAFVLAELLTQRKNSSNNRKYLKSISEREFHKRLLHVKKKVLKIKERDLDKLISPKWPKRINSYNGSQWFLAEVSPKEVGVWSRAGDLPLRWTNSSLFETAEKVKKAFEVNSKLLKRRPKHTIPSILAMQTHREQTEKYLYPIVFKTDTGTRGRSRLKRKMKGDIDDGCMRSIALAVNDRNPITVYFGIPIKK